MDPSRPGRLSGSLTVIETDTDRCGTYDFLLMIHTHVRLLDERLTDRNLNNDTARPNVSFKMQL